MNDYNWCHNPKCHTIETQSRVRGSGDNKVLRTRKVPLNSEWRRTSIWAYFCNQNCLHAFLDTFKREVTNIRPVAQPSETPIRVVKESYESYRYQYSNGQSNRVPYQATRLTITKG